MNKGKARRDRIRRCMMLVKSLNKQLDAAGIKVGWIDQNDSSHAVFMRDDRKPIGRFFPASGRVTTGAGEFGYVESLDEAIRVLLASVKERAERAESATAGK